EDDVGLVEGEVDLLADGGLEPLLAPGHQPAGVDHVEEVAGPLGLAVEPVPRHAGLVVGDGLAGLGEPVEQRALADVGPADDGDEGHGEGKGEGEGTREPGQSAAALERPRTPEDRAGKQTCRARPVSRCDTTVTGPLPRPGNTAAAPP